MISSRKAVFLVGLTILLAGAWMIATVIYLRGALAARRVYYVEAVFPDALGIREQARVYLAGVEVGEVQKIWLTPDLQARVRLALRREVSIPEDTVAVVMSPGIAGVDKLIALMPGKSPVMAQEGTTLRGVKEPGISDIAPVAQQTLQEVQKLVRSANEWLTDAEIRSSIKQTLRNVQQASARLDALTEQAGQLLVGTGRSLDAVVRDARLSTRLLPQILADLQALLEQSRELLRTAQHATESLDQFVSDEQLQQSLRDTAREMRLLSTQLNRIAEDISKYTGDEELRQNVRATVAEARATLTEARQATEKVNRFVERLIQPAAFSLRPMDVSLELYALLHDETFRTDLALTLPYRENRFFYVGLYDVAESNKIIAQYGSPWAPGLNLRYGLYASKPGVGMDWQLSPRLELRTDLFNPKELQVNTRVRLQLGSDWSLWAGVDSLFRKNQPIIGLQITR
ncbi:MAG: MlaD family protein [bacterium]|nr:MlaD family protein [bacterium]MCS7308752.1 MlaD family protein [Armatimonadota bacterium]